MDAGEPSASSILVVDDDADILSLLVEVFREEGYNVLAASNGQQAVDVALTRLPRLILMDMMLPVLDGPSVISHLKSNPVTAAIPIIAVSASTALFSQRQAIPADSFVAKPFDIWQLIDLVAEFFS